MTATALLGLALLVGPFAFPATAEPHFPWITD